MIPTYINSGICIKLPVVVKVAENYQFIPFDKLQCWVRFQENWLERNTQLVKYKKGWNWKTTFYSLSSDLSSMQHSFEDRSSDNALHSYSQSTSKDETAG